MNTARTPIVSVIITTHKGADVVCNAVRSVINQSYKNIEIIVVDDNGQGTEEQIKTFNNLKAYIDADTIKYIAHEKNKNGSAARNTGFKASTGEVIGFLDDDDIYLGEKISKSVELLASLDEKWGAVYTDVEICYSNSDKYIIKSHKKGNILFPVLTHTIFLNPATMLIKRSAVEKINGFDESFARHQDFEFNARLANEINFAHLKLVGSRYNCQIKRHVDFNKVSQYRDYYIQKMMPIIKTFSKFRQNVLLAKNAIEICGISLKKMKQCRITTKKWLRDCGVLAYFTAFVITALERINYRLSKQ